MRVVAWALAAALVVGGAIAAQQTASTRKLGQRQQFVQALNRLTWGIAPGDVDAVEKMGLKQWIDLQLHPERIPENPELTAMLAPLDTLRMPPGEMLQHYPSNQLIQQMAMGRRPLPSDPRLRPVVEREVEAYRSRLAQKNGGAGGASPQEPDPRLQMEAAGSPLEQILDPERNHSGLKISAIETGPPRQRAEALEALPPDTRAAALASLPRQDALQIAPWVPVAQAHEIAYNWQPQQVVALDLTGAKVLRAVYTNRQLEDVLTDFWFNHFNIYIHKGIDGDLVTAYERDTIRPHVLGKFSDLLLATAKSPAMLFYLDNWQSVDPNAGARIAAARAMRVALQRRDGFIPFGPPPAVQLPPAAAPQRGRNENYGREVMELHTVGLNYTQADVIAVARCFTGWTIRQPQVDPEFFYNDQLHDKGAKVVLGVNIPAGGGMSDGLKAIDILSHSPATAHHISYELAQRFVADDPPPALVDRMSATFLKSDGDLRQVMETMIDSPEFWQERYYRDKVKSPLEMVVSAVRGLDAQVSNPTRLAQVIAAMGEPLYAKLPPDGYGNAGAAWASSSGLLARFNFALQLAANQIPGVEVDLSRFTSGDDQLTAVEQNLFQGLLYGQASPSTEAAIEREAADAGGEATPAKIQQIAGLVLGSPDFQRR